MHCVVIDIGSGVCVQAPILIAELELKRIWRAKGWRQPPFIVSLVVTLLCMYFLSDPLFFAPVDTDSDLAQRVVVAVQNMFVGFGAMVEPVLGKFSESATGQLFTKAANSFMSRGSDEL